MICLAPYLLIRKKSVKGRHADFDAHRVFVLLKLGQGESVRLTIAASDALCKGSEIGSEAQVNLSASMGPRG